MDEIIGHPNPNRLIRENRSGEAGNEQCGFSRGGCCERLFHDLTNLLCKAPLRNRYLACRRNLAFASGLDRENREVPRSSALATNAAILDSCENLKRVKRRYRLRTPNETTPL